MNTPIVFVLGAGFTKAFDVNAPLLLVEDSVLNDLKNKFPKEHFPSIQRFFKSIKKDRDNKINIEELMTRLYTNAPYDEAAFLPGEREMLLEAVKEIFSKLIKKIKSLEKMNQTERSILEQFSQFIIGQENKSCVISFNYDTLLDEALFGENGKDWHPDGCYGFFCPPSTTCIDTEAFYKNSNKVVLLKLHGSKNWRAKLGSAKPYSISDIVHDLFENEKKNFEKRKKVTRTDLEFDEIEDHLEKESFIIPPVLDKSILSQEPVLRLIWGKAYQKLIEAKTIVFIGYSLPQTDMAAKFLFRESLLANEKSPEIIIIHKEKDDSEIKLEERYRECLSPEILNGGGKTFKNIDAKEWIKEKIIPTITPDILPNPQ